MSNLEYEAISKAKHQRESNNAEGAVNTLENYLKTDPHNTKPRLLLAKILIFDLEKKDYGLLQLNIILDLEPDNYDARKALVTVLKKKKADAKETDMHYTYLTEHCPEDADLMNSYAIFCKMQLADFNKASEYYQKAILLKPSNPDYHLNYAILLVNDLKKYTEGKQQMEMVVELDPSNTRAIDALKKLNKDKFKDDKEKKGFFARFKK